ncbi:T9SS type B sorting domain-containing protein [Chitinophaga sancti]|uniref:Calx-beta domain-containing protein n=1 Tax=Chitinophaga sancti TaxID=1004 RepID=A0A1K1PRV5_9BACT|nr:Calx-beta domain-containing protein [Chitinophaga sancti]WQD61732.1 Calx-beta domain-containing protein [Chitinophaga sancti]WQG92710.1 Calx-beta domain-containing protein [Chitinophaga sancti]SFW50187.1 gliding motility-associated C-terminal domain-containing protein [Chitinophaga sancti]
MFKLPNSVKRNATITPRKVSHTLKRMFFAVLLLLICSQSQVIAQTVKATINPTGGASGSKDLKIDIYTDGSIVVTRNGLTESYNRADSSLGMRAFFDFKNLAHMTDRTTPQAPGTCYISPISGSGSYADPYKIHVVGTVLDPYFKYPTGQTGTVTCIITYVKNTSYFFLDYVLHMPQVSTNDFTSVLFYLSEQVVMGPNATANPDEASKCGYGFINSDSSTIGMYRDVACTETAESPRSHVYRMYRKFRSWQASIPENRFYLDDDGLYPHNVIADGVDGRGRSMGIMRSMPIYDNNFTATPVNYRTFRVLSGYGTTKNEFDTVGAMVDSIPVTGWGNVSVQFSSATQSTNEGSAAQGEHIDSSVTLKVSGGKLNAPVYVLLQYDSTYNYAHPAARGTDFTLAEQGALIPAGDYTTAKTIKIPNLHIIGNDKLEFSRTVRLKLAATCTDLITISGTSQCDFTIVDDEVRGMTLTMDSSAILEGNATKARVKMTSTCPEDVVITFSTHSSSTAGDTDYVVPASVTIPANSTYSPEFTISAKADKVLENTENLVLQFKGTVLGIDVTGQTNLTINDSTYFNPAYAQILSNFVNPSSVNPITEGYEGYVRFHLPDGVSTEVPITVNVDFNWSKSTASDGVDFDFWYYNGPVTIPKLGTGANIYMIAYTDDLLEGSTPETIVLDVTTTDAVGAGRSYPYKGDTLKIKDANYDSSMVMTMTPVPATILEGVTSTVTLSLPNGLKAGSAMTIPIARGISSKAIASDVTMSVTNLTIGKGKSSATFTVKALKDSLLENDEPYYVVASPTGFIKDSCLITIRDTTGLISGNKVLNLSITTPSLKEGNSSNLTLAFAKPGIMAGDSLAIVLTPGGTTVASPSDYYIGAANTIYMPPNTNSKTVTNGFSALADGVLENTEAFTFTAATTSLSGLTINAISGSILDATADNAANRIVTITPAVTEMEEGSSYTYTFSLPPGITTEVPITITPSIVSSSTADASDFSLDSATITLNTTHPSSNVTAINIVQDNILESDEQLTLGGTATTALPAGITVNQAATVTIKDKTELGSFTLSADRTDIVEGGVGAYITISLPGTPPAPLTLNISRGSSSQASSGYSGLPQTLTMTTSSITIPVPVSALTDNIIGDNETLVVLVAATGYPSDSVTLNMIDVTANDPANMKITFTPEPASQGDHVEEGNTYTVRASFPAGIKLFTPVTLNVTASNQSVASASDYTGVPATVTIDTAGYGDFVITAKADYVIEGSELLRISGNTPGMSNVSVDSLDLYINDAPASTQLQMIIDSSTIHKGSTTKVTIGFVNSSMTSASDIIITVIPDGSSTADTTNYTGLPRFVTLPKDSNHVTFFLNIPNNFKIEGPTVLQFVDSAAGYSFASIAPLNILDPEGQPVTLEKVNDAAEPATDGAFKVVLPAVSTTDVSVTLTATYAGTNIKDVQTTVVIPAGSLSVTVPVNIIDDIVLQGNLVLQVKLVGATTVQGGTTKSLYVSGGTMYMNVFDDESSDTGTQANARTMIIERLADATQPSANGQFRIRFNDSTLIATQDVTVSYTVSGTAVAGTDYGALSGSVVIPAGSSMVTFDVVPSGKLTAGPTTTVISSLKGVTSNIPLVTWPISTINGIATVFIYNMNVDTPQVNLFASTSTIVEGDSVKFFVRTTKSINLDLPITVAITNDVYRTVTIRNGVVSGNKVTVTMPAGAQETSFTVVVDDNDLNDDDGWVQANVQEFDPLSSGPAYYVGLANEIRNSVTDNDSLTIGFSETQFSAVVPFDTTGFPLPFVLKMNRASSRIITIYYEFYEPGSSELLAGTMVASAGKDYDASVTPLLIMPNTSTTSIPVLVNSVEKNKMFGMRLLRATVSSTQNIPKLDSLSTATGLIEICKDCDVDGDGVPDYIERFITDGRWKDNNNGNLRVHPAMSPNGDGLGNDAMYIENIDSYPDNDVTVFNRWGGTVFTTKGYNNSSNNFNGKANTGSAKNQDVPDGSYFFIIHATDVSGKKIKYTGFLVIKRS